MAINRKFRVARAIGAGGAIVALSAGVAGANIFDDAGIDPRVIQPRTGIGYQYAPIGLIRTTTPMRGPNGEDLTSSASGTGFLVSPCYALTNHHVAFDEEQGAKAPQATIVFEAINPDGFTTRPVNATPVRWGERSASGVTRDDWALLRLDECVGSQLGWLELADLSDAEVLGATVTEAGYSGDRDQRFLWLEPACRMYPPNREQAYVETFFHDCSSTAGNSGSPVFIVTDRGLRVVGIDEGEFGRTLEVIVGYTEDLANIAVDIRQVIPQIADLIGPDAAGRDNPAARPVPAVDTARLRLDLERELTRHGCLGPGAAPSIEGAAATYDAVSDQAGIAGAPDEAPAEWARLLEVLRVTPAPFCTDRAIQPFTVGTTATGDLAPADRIDAYGTFADCFVVTATQTQWVEFSVSSRAFDTFLEVGPLSTERNCSTAPLSFIDDDGGEGTNSELVAGMKPGDYIVRITSFSVGEVGSYTLTAEPTTPPIR